MLTQDVDGFSRIWTARVRADPLALRVIEALWLQREDFLAHVVERARQESHEIDGAFEVDMVESQRHVRDHFRAVTALATGRMAELGADPLAFIREHGVRRARQRVPLRASLQAYRTGHKMFWAAICALITKFTETADAGLKTTMLLSDYSIEYTDLISIILTDAYVEEEAKIVDERTRLSMAVVEDLLRGLTPRGDAGRELCRASGLGDERPMVVAVARRMGSEAKDYLAREGSGLARAIEAGLRRQDFGGLVDMRLDEIVVIISHAGQPGRNAAAAFRDLVPSLPGLATACARIGIGLDVDQISELPRSYAEARVALDFVGIDGPVVHLAEVSVDAYLQSTADATARRLVPAATQAVRGGVLARTLEAFAAANLNVKACAARLGVHNNTVYYRLNRVHRLTGIDPRTYAGLSQLMTALALASA